MITLRAIHQIRGVKVTKRKAKNADAKENRAYPGDIFQTDSVTAKRLIDGGNAVVPGENPSSLDTTPRVANAYENLDDEDGEEELSLSQIAPRLEDAGESQPEKPVKPKGKGGKSASSNLAEQVGELLDDQADGDDSLDSLGLGDDLVTGE